MFSTITSVPSMMIPKSIAPIDSRFASTPLACRQMNENSSARGIVRATMTAARTLTRKIKRTNSTSSMPQEVAFNRVDSHPDQVATIVKRMNFDVRRQDVLVEVVGHCLDALQDVLRLFAAAHQDHAFDRVVCVHEAKLA